jgi:Phosphotransferase enzyme family
MTDPAETDFPDWLTGPQSPHSPLGPGAVLVSGELLREWGLSEVWRLRLGGQEPRSVIVKRGTGEMAQEARRYRELVVPLGIPAPGLLAAQGGDDGQPVVLVLEDVGGRSLEQWPTARGYEEAVRTLARMRVRAAQRLAHDPAIGTGLRRTVGDFADTADLVGDALARLRPDLAGSLDGPAKVLMSRLDRLAAQPATIVHGDFQAKNLIHGPAGSIIAVDWPGAYVHPHLGDLYLLLREARHHERVLTVDADALIMVFAQETRTDPAAVRDQLTTGGLCWTMLALRWVVEEGIRTVPVSADWIDELVAETRSLAGSAQGCS